MFKSAALLLQVVAFLYGRGSSSRKKKSLITRRMYGGPEGSPVFILLTEKIY